MTKTGDPTPFLDVGRLRLLREVGLRGSIAGAARELGLTPSAVSQQLAVLERETGIALVDRSPRGVALTGAGIALAQRAGEVLDVLTAARADLDRLGGAVAGRVNVLSVAGAAVTIVSDAARTLAAESPDVELIVATAEPDTSLPALVAGDAELAVVDEYDYVPVALPETLRSVELCTEAMMLVVSDVVGDGEPEPSGNLDRYADVDWVLPPAAAACGQAVRSACRAAGFEPRVRWESDDMYVLAHAVAAGHGVSVLPARSIARELPVRVVELRRPKLARRLLIVARGSTLTRPVVVAAVDALHAAAGT